MSKKIKISELWSKNRNAITKLASHLKSTTGACRLLKIQPTRASKNKRNYKMTLIWAKRLNIKIAIKYLKGHSNKYKNKIITVISKLYLNPPKINLNITRKFHPLAGKSNKRRVWCKLSRVGWVLTQLRRIS